MDAATGTDPGATTAGDGVASLSMMFIRARAQTRRSIIFSCYDAFSTPSSPVFVIPSVDHLTVSVPFQGLFAVSCEKDLV